MTAESENWTTAQLWVFLGSYMTSMRCLRYGHKEKCNYFDEKSCLSVLLNHFKRLFHLVEFLNLRFDAV